MLLSSIAKAHIAIDAKLSLSDGKQKRTMHSKIQFDEKEYTPVTIQSNDIKLNIHMLKKNDDGITITVEVFKQNNDDDLEEIESDI